MNYLQKAHVFNNLGASLLMDGNCERSIEAFTHALDQLEKCCSVVGFIEPSLNPLTIHSVKFCDEDTRLNLFGGHFNVYSKVIIFTPGLIQTSLSSHDLAFCLAAVSFNIGVSHHCSGMKKCNSRLLLKAINLYKVAFELVNEIALFSDISQQLMISARNNMSHIFLELEESQKYLDSLDFLQLLIEAMQSEGGTCPILKNEDIEDFVFNIWHRGQRFAAASA